MSFVLDGLPAYGVLARISPEGRGLLDRHARPIHVGPSLFRQEGDACETVTMLSRGLVRVSKLRASGREISLYTFGPGDLCVLETLAVLAGTTYRAEAVIEEEVSGVAIPGDVFRAAVDREPALRAFLFESFEARLALTLDLVSDVALGTLEARLAALLLRHAQGSTSIRVTHEALSHQLACAREAVSRILGSWERAGVVRLGRAQIQVLDPARLLDLAGTADAHVG